MRGIALVLVATTLLGGCAGLGRPSPAAARQDAASGQRFVQRACAGCHAVEPTGASPNPHAPPFRTLAGRLPGRALDEQLSTIARRGHVEMPPIYMTPDEIGAVAAYIRGIAQSDGRPAGSAT
jgi:mono/diheme cytochrome c family protein